jgi:hypothetical protein
MPATHVWIRVWLFHLHAHTCMHAYIHEYRLARVCMPRSVCCSMNMSLHLYVCQDMSRHVFKTKTCLFKTKTCLVKTKTCLQNQDMSLQNRHYDVWNVSTNSYYLSMCIDTYMYCMKREYWFTSVCTSRSVSTKPLQAVDIKKIFNKKKRRSWPPWVLFQAKTNQSSTIFAACAWCFLWLKWILWFQAETMNTTGLSEAWVS